MKKILFSYVLYKAGFVLSLSLILNSITFSQGSGWIWQNPLPQNNSLNSVFTLDGSTAFAVGDNGTYLKTTDGGNNWIINSGLTSDRVSFKSIQFSSEKIGWIIGSNNIFLKTTDVGKSWIKISPPIERKIISLNFINDTIGFLGADSGVIYKTYDSGLNWNRIKLNDSTIEINAFSFVDSLNGWLVGKKDTVFWSNGIIMKTTNGGKTWLRINNTYSDYYRSIQFVNNTTGYIGINNTFLKTVDGGETWKQIFIDSYFYAYSLYFSDKNNGIAVGTRNQIFYTNNGGTSWNKFDFNAFTSENFYSVHFIGDTGWAVGTSGRIIKTTNKGITWKFQSKGFTNDLHFVKAVNPDTIFTLGLNISNGWSTILNRSIDGGKNWSVTKSWNSIRIESFYISQGNTIWAVGTGIFKSTDLGISWLQNTVDTTLWLYSVNFIDSLIGFCVGLNGKICKTSDGGKNWTLIKSGTTSGLLSVNFVNKDVGWISGENAIILKTIDGGNTWFRQFIDFDYTLRNIFFINENLGWVTGDQIFKTTDGGNNWIFQFQSNTYIKSMQFLNENIGYACGNNGVVLKTIDGGYKWEYQKITTDLALNSISFISENVGWLVGDKGTILKAENGGLTSVKDFPVKAMLQDEFYLNQNYPNPFNPITTIEYKIPYQEKVILKIYNLLGEVVYELVNHEREAGSYKIIFDGSRLLSGIYFYQLSAGKYLSTRKMILLK